MKEIQKQQRSLSLIKPKLKRRYGLGLLVAWISLIGYYCLNPILLHSTGREVDFVQPDDQCCMSQNINLFKKVNLDQGHFKAILLLTDKEKIVQTFSNGKIFYTEDIQLLKKIQEQANFTLTHSDLCTVENTLRLYRDGILIDEVAVVLEENKQGIQSMRYGWATSNSPHFIRLLSEFKRYYYPLIRG